MSRELPAPTNFIENMINEDVMNNFNDGRVQTRFPPEPNGYLHIGHAKAICLDFGIAQKYQGLCSLRFDDTNPAKEEQEYVDGIMADIHWLGFDWEDRLYFASDYFPQIYDFAVQLIKDGKAYVDDLSPEEMREYRGTLTEPGKNSPYRDRSVEENLDLFERMKNGEFPEGSRVLRAKIDMTSPNINMRDPVLYRIKKAHHHRTGADWFIYPMYDYAHPISDALEGVTHSLCSLEYEDHRPLYYWFINNCNCTQKSRPRQIEFARLNMTRTIMSKRKLLKVVESGVVDGWDDPRMPTIAGLRRRGFTSESIQNFCEEIGVAKANSTVDVAMLEHFIRQDLNSRALRVMAVLKPLKVVITNFPEGQVEELEAENNPENPDMGTRTIPFSREIFIEEDDFLENPPKKFFRLSPGQEVRLKHAYIIRCEDVIKDAEGNIVELHCTYDPETRSGSGNSRKVKGTLHWVSAAHALPAEVHLYDYLLLDETPVGEEEDEKADFLSRLNPHSLEVLSHVLVEPGLKGAEPGSKYQFLRHGYFCVDTRYTTPEKLVFNRTVSLKDTWSKVAQS